jgi:hypothetical protein
MGGALERHAAPRDDDALLRNRRHLPAAARRDHRGAVQPRLGINP